MRDFISTSYNLEPKQLQCLSECYSYCIFENSCYTSWQPPPLLKGKEQQANSMSSPWQLRAVEVWKLPGNSNYMVDFSYSVTGSRVGGIELCVFHYNTVIITRDVIPLPDCLLQWGYGCRIVSQNYVSTLDYSLPEHLCTNPGVCMVCKPIRGIHCSLPAETVWLYKLQMPISLWFIS